MSIPKNVIELFTPGEIQATEVIQRMVDQICGEGAMLYHEGRFVCTEREFIAGFRDDWLDHLRHNALARLRSRLEAGGAEHGR